MSHTLIDRNGVTVGRYAGRGGVAMIQVTVSDEQGGCTFASMTLREFDHWLADLLGEMNRVALEAGDPPDPRTVEAMRGRPRTLEALLGRRRTPPHVKNGPHCTCPNDDYHDRVYGEASE
jgi:hypothetical protein